MNNVAVSFKVKNYTGSISELGETPSALSGYTLPITPFIFYPDPTAQLNPGDFIQYVSENTSTVNALVTAFSGQDIDLSLADIYTFIVDAEGGLPLDYSRTRIVWYFGDGTYSTDLTATHYYKDPGVYNVSCVFFDQSGNTYQNVYDAPITVYNFVTDGFLIESDYFTSNAYVLTAGRIENPFDIAYNYSWQTYQSLSATGGVNYRFTSLSATANYLDLNLDKNKYGHLYPYSSFYQIQTNVINNQDVLEPIQDSNCRAPVSLYCKMTGGNVYYTTSDDIGSVFCGISGIETIYFKDGLTHDNINLVVTPYNKSNGVNILPVAFNCQIANNTALSALAITSTGITGEGSKTNTFDINSIKYVGQKINFVVTVKDQDWYTVPLSSNFALGDITSNTFNITAYLADSTGTPILTAGTITSNFSYLSSISGGFFRGIFAPTTTCEDVHLVAQVGLNDMFGNHLSGTSSTFSVYPSGGEYVVSKVNENFDWTSQMKNLRFQEFLQDYPIMFDDFFGSIYGNLSSDPISMGKLPNEKIGNFVSNKCKIDTCDVDSLFSMSYELQANFKQFEKNNFSYPARFKRLVDLLSINYSRLRGNANAFNQNFDNKYGADNTKYGLNLGAKLDFATTTLTAVEGFIVAYEKYSSTFKLCNTFIPFTTTNTVFSLSDFNANWGWGLTLGDVVSGEDITKYYDFYDYIPLTDNTILDGTIDYNNVLNTLTFTNSSYNTWVRTGGIMDDLISNALYTGVNILSS